MARRLIGLDVGTNAVTVAEVSAGSIPRLELGWGWAAALAIAMFALLAAAAAELWRTTGFN